MTDVVRGSGKKRRIGVFGGTFDPVHIGHLILAERAREELGLDALLFVPARIPPHKTDGRKIAPTKDRIAMLRLALQQNSHFAISTYEVERERVSYTVETLHHLREEHRGAELTLLIGSDNARDFHVWRNPEEITQMARVAVWARPEHDTPAEILPGVGYTRIDAPLLEISSTDIRERVAASRSIQYLTPDPVVEYINQHGLYR